MFISREAKIVVLEKFFFLFFFSPIPNKIFSKTKAVQQKDLGKSLSFL